MWAALAEAPRPVLLNIATRTLQTDLRQWIVPAVLQRASTFLGVPGGVTHVLAVPLLGPGERLAGMVTWSLHAPAYVRRPLSLEEEPVERLVELSDAASWVAALPAPVGQDDEMSQLLAQPPPEVGEAVLLVGPPGCGKGWSARQIAARWAGEPTEVVDGRTVSVGTLEAALRESSGALVLLHADELGSAPQERMAHTPWSRPLIATASLRAERALLPALARLGRWTLAMPELASRSWTPLVASIVTEHFGGAPAVPEAAVQRLSEVSFPQGLRDVIAVLRLARGAGGAWSIEAIERAITRVLQPDGSLLDAMRPAARAIWASDRPVPLRALQGLGGLVIEEALATGATRVEVGRRFGRRDGGGGGNEAKALAPWLNQLDVLRDALGEPPSTSRQRRPP